MTHEELCRMEQSQLVKLIDEGKLVYLPCKVEDTVYFWYNENHLEDVIIKKIVITETYGLAFYAKSIYNDKLFSISDIGKTVFLTLEEAEKALKEMESKNNG